MKVYFSVGLISVLMLSSIARGDAAKEGENIDGVWLPGSAELAGKKLPDEVLMTIKLEVKEGKYTVTVGATVDRGTIKLNREAKPREVDITGSKGPSKDKTILAIFERDGDTLRICYDLSGKARPTEFKTKEGTKQFFGHLQAAQAVKGCEHFAVSLVMPEAPRSIEAAKSVAKWLKLAGRHRWFGSTCSAVSICRTTSWGQVGCSRRGCAWPSRQISAFSQSSRSNLSISVFSCSASRLICRSS